MTMTRWFCAILLLHAPTAQAADPEPHAGTRTPVEDPEHDDEDEQAEDSEDDSEADSRDNSEGGSDDGDEDQSDDDQSDDDSESDGTSQGEDDGASDSDAPRPRALALSVGTGPLPVDTLTLGVTGLAGRILVPAGPGSVAISGGHTSFRGSTFPDTGFADRDFTRAGATTVAVGYRGGSPPAEPAVLPYGVVQAMGIRANTATGNPGDVWGTGLWAAGALAGIGVDAFLTPHISAGVEVGGMADFALGGENNRGDRQTTFSAIALSTFASAQLTVWK